MLAKYAILHFREHKDTHNHRDAMIQVSSSVADAVVPRYATYGATKAFNNIFASLIANQLERSSTT